MASIDKTKKTEKASKSLNVTTETMPCPMGNNDSSKGLNDDRNGPPSKKPRTDVPDYGSKGYWEERYRRQLSKVDDKASEDDTLPYHSWYFTYDDLRPLILPLILGGRNDVYDMLKQAAEENNQDEDKDDKVLPTDSNQTTESSIKDNKDHEELSTVSDGRDNGDDDDDTSASAEEHYNEEDDDEFVEVDDDDDDGVEEDPIEREGLSKDGPISVIEIGCGDVPLGAGLALELKQLEGDTGASASKIVRQILCTDYSPTVIQTMKKQYKMFDPTESQPKHSADIGQVPLEFVVADARNLTYPPRCFDLILEKGTLDAVLSDREKGIANSIQIMRECARILSMDGYMVLVSHLNAHTERGIGWLQDVVFEGLRSGDPEAAYMIEVHGNTEISDSPTGTPPGSPGPAVYVIRKKHFEKQGAQSSIPVKFYSY